MPKPRIPDSDSIIYCIKCRKPMNARGWFGPGCVGHEPPKEKIRDRPNDYWGGRLAE